MKLPRLLLVAAGIVMLLAVAAVVAGLNSTVQTWAVRKALASQPGLRTTVGAVSAGVGRVAVKDLRIEREGAVLTVPAVDVRLSWFAALRSKAAISQLVAKGWTVDLSKTSAPSAAGSPAGAAAAPAAAAPGSSTASVPPPAPAKPFSGVFGHLQVPVDLSIDGLDLEGDVILPDARGKAKVALKGGGLGASREGRFDLHATAELKDPEVNAVELRGELFGAMETPRLFSRLTARLDAAARGVKFPKGVKIRAELGATRASGRESYSAALVNEGGELLTVNADFPRGAQRVEGTWKVDLRDEDVVPFALGRPLPAFTAVGGGKFDTDATFSAVHASGRLNATADRLQVIKPELAALGELKLAADFDLAERDGLFVVEKFEAAVGAAEPIAKVRALQSFEFRPRSGDLRATDATSELLGIMLEGVPLAWAKPFLKDITIEGGPVRGQLAASARGGGITVRSTSPLTVPALSVAQPGKPLVRDLDLTLEVSADYTPQGWQAELGTLTARSGGATVATLQAKAGQLAGREQPLKATGNLALHLPAVLQQPAATGALLLHEGNAAIDFVASLSRQHELQAKLVLDKLVTVADGKPLNLPAVSADLRADLSPDGKIAFNAPLVLQQDNRKSDLTLAGTIAPLKDGVRAIDAQVTSGNLVIDDAKVFANLAPAKAAASGAEPKPGAANLPPWAGVSGSVALQLKRIIYSDTFEVTDLVGRVQIDEGVLKLENVRAGLGENGRASINGAVTFKAAAPQPYGLTADVLVKEFDPGPLFHALNRNEPPTIEGRFDVSSKLASRAATLEALAAGAGGDFQLTSKGGMFRGLPVNVGKVVEHTGKLAGIIATAGNMIGGLTGRRDADIANKSQAIAEFSKGLNPIPYDQLSFVLSRDAALNTTIRDFTLISPEVRLTGGGTLLHREGSTLLDDPLAVEYKLRARGRMGDLLKYLGALEAQPDDLGYTACTLPLKVTGTLNKPDTSELNARLAALAMEKAGVTEKASELFNRVFGGGK